MTKAKYALLAGAAGVLMAAPAMAQKSKDTVRIGVDQPISVVDIVYDPQPQTTLTTWSVFDSLLWYDAEKRDFGGLLAKSWTRIDDKTVEFTLKEGITFHDGSELDADDVVYSIAHVTDPKAKFRFKSNRYGWIDKVEKLGKYSVRVTSKTVFAPFLTRMAVSLHIFPNEHAKLEDKTQFGKAPVGTGSMRVVSVSDNAGVVEEKWDGYKHGGDLKPAAQVGRIHFMPIPDKQSQVANMLTGNQDIMYEVQTDQAENLKQNPDLNVLVYPTVQFSYLYPDTANRSGIGVFTDERVRRAFFHAVNREAMKEAFVPKEGHDQPLPSGMCHEWHVGCVHDAKPVGYDPAKAEALLKEAGWDPNLEIKLTVWGAAIRQAEAVAGYLRKVGVKASVNAVPFGVYNRLRNEGSIHAFVSFWDNGGAQPDVDGTAGFFFDKGPRNFHHDARLTELAELGEQELDLEKRKAIYREAFNRATEKHYFHPLIPMPATVVHHKDVVLQGGHKSPKGFLPNRIAWAK